MTRIWHPEILPLEFLQLLPFAPAVWEKSLRRGLAFALVKFLRWLHTEGFKPGRERGEYGNRHQFDAVLLTGGHLQDLDLRQQLTGTPFPTLFCEEPIFGGERGGFALLHAQRLSGWVVDLGQTQLKISTPGHRWTFARDFRRLRLAGTVPEAAVPNHRQRLRDFIALNLRTTLSATGQRPCALVFALPARVAEDGTPSANSYVGMNGDRSLLPEAVALAGLSRTRVFVLNDAELAAHSARLDSRLAAYRKVLVLTLGFGIGAALILRR